MQNVSTQSIVMDAPRFGAENIKLSADSVGAGFGKVSQIAGNLENAIKTFNSPTQRDVAVNVGDVNFQGAQAGGGSMNVILLAVGAFLVAKLLKLF